jgi:hypothetical protein
MARVGAGALPVEVVRISLNRAIVSRFIVFIVYDFGASRDF